MKTGNSKKTVASKSLLEVDALTSAIKEESKNTISNLLKEEVANYLREAVDGDEDDYEVKDEEQASADVDDKENDSQDVESTEASEDSQEEPEVEVEENDTEAEDSPEEDGEEGFDFDQYKVDDDTYDLTGENDYEEVVKVYKRLNNDDNVIVKKDGDKVTIKDNDADTEYVIDLGGDGSCEDTDEDSFETDELNEEAADDIAGLPYTNEGKKNRKTMKENKETIFEVDLGYTDNYQKEDPIEGLSNNEPSNNKTWDKVPTGTKKPWAGNAKAEGDPYEKEVNEEVEPIMSDGEDKNEPVVNEGPARTSVKKAHRVKSVTNNGNPQIAPERQPNSDNGKLNEAKYRAMIESLIKKTEAVLKENQELRAAMPKVQKALQETLVVCANLGKFAKIVSENTTTQEEKKQILNRFNEAKSFKESKTLYETISRELKQGAKQTLPLQEVSMTTNGSAINETKLYESQDITDIKNFMKRMENC